MRSVGWIWPSRFVLSRGAAAGLALGVGAEAERLLAHPALDHLVEADERAAADEQDVRGVDLVELLVRVLAPALRRHVRDRALEDLQQRLLHALARDVAGDRGVLVLARDLVDLVDVDDPLLALLDVPARRLQQLQDDVLDVLADVAGLGEGRGVHDGEGDGEQARQGLGQQGLAGAGGADQQDVRLRELDVVAAALLADLDALVVVVDRDRQLLLGLLLPDHVLVEELLDLLRGGEAVRVTRPSARRSSAMMSLQTSTHSSQMKTVGPAISLRTSFWSLLQNEQRRTSPSPLPAFLVAHFSRLRDHVVDDAVGLRLVRFHDEVAVGVGDDLLERLLRVAGRGSGSAGP